MKTQEKGYEYYSDIAQGMWVSMKRKLIKDKKIFELFSNYKDIPKDKKGKFVVIETPFGTLIENI